MRILAWTLRIVMFLALFLFALKNTETIKLHLYFDQVWQAPLILVLLVFFAGGAVIGVLGTLVTVFRQRRTIARLQRELRATSSGDQQQAPVIDGGLRSGSGL